MEHDSRDMCIPVVAADQQRHAVHSLKDAAVDDCERKCSEQSRGSKSWKQHVEREQSGRSLTRALRALQLQGCQSSESPVAARRDGVGGEEHIGRLQGGRRRASP